MKTSSSTTIIGAIVLFISSIAFAQQSTTPVHAAATTAATSSGAVQKGHKEHPLKALIEAYHSQIKSYLAQKKSEHKTFKESLKSKTPAEQKTMIDQFRTQQAGDIKSYVTQQRNDLVSKIQSSGIPDEYKSKITAKLQERWAKVDAQMEKQMQENKQTIDQIYSDGVIGKEEKEMWKEQAQTQHKENKEFFKNLKVNNAKGTTAATSGTTASTTSGTAAN